MHETLACHQDLKPDSPPAHVELTQRLARSAETKWNEESALVEHARNDGIPEGGGGGGGGEGSDAPVYLSSTRTESEAQYTHQSRGTNCYPPRRAQDR